MRQREYRRKYRLLGVAAPASHHRNSPAPADVQCIGGCCSVPTDRVEKLMQDKRLVDRAHPLMGLVSRIAQRPASRACRKPGGFRPLPHARGFEGALKGLLSRVRSVSVPWDTAVCGMAFAILLLCHLLCRREVSAPQAQKNPAQWPGGGLSADALPAALQ